MFGIQTEILFFYELAKNVRSCLTRGYFPNLSTYIQRPGIAAFMMTSSVSAAVQFPQLKAYIGLYLLLQRLSITPQLTGMKTKKHDAPRLSDLCSYQKLSSISTLSYLSNTRWLQYFVTLRFGVEQVCHTLNFTVSEGSATWVVSLLF